MRKPMQSRKNKKTISKKTFKNGRNPYSKNARTAKRMLYKNKGGMFDMFATKKPNPLNPLIQLHKSPSPFEPAQYQTKVTNYVSSILADGGYDLYKVSDNVIDYFTNYKITNNCSSQENAKIKVTLTGIVNFIMNTSNRNPSEKKLISEFTNNIVPAIEREALVQMEGYNRACVNPVVAKPVVAKPVVAKPVVAKPVVAKPVVAKPVVAK
jgi:hypothetical protein